MIDAGCDVLCVNLVDRTAPSRIIRMAKQEDIPVLFFNREPVREDLMQWEKLYYRQIEFGQEMKVFLLQIYMMTGILCMYEKC